jgi:hypothetical protein
MIDLFEIGPRDAASDYPKTAMVHRVRCAAGVAPAEEH